MLAEYFDIKPTGKPPHVNLPPPEPKNKKSRPPKPPKPPKATKASAKHVVEPYDEGGTVHARFDSSVSQTEPRGVAGSCVAECELVGGGDAEEGADPYEYLWQEANHGACTEEDDTDSCVTFEDDVSESTERLSSSPAEPAFEVFFSKRKGKASEAPVYSGPELWYEDDEFIE